MQKSTFSEKKTEKKCSTLKINIPRLETCNDLMISVTINSRQRRIESLFFCLKICTKDNKDLLLICLDEVNLKILNEEFEILCNTKLSFTQSLHESLKEFSIMQ